MGVLGWVLLEAEVEHSKAVRAASVLLLGLGSREMGKVPAQAAGVARAVPPLLTD